MGEIGEILVQFSLLFGANVGVAFTWILGDLKQWLHQANNSIYHISHTNVIVVVVAAAAELQLLWQTQTLNDKYKYLWYYMILLQSDFTRYYIALVWMDHLSFHLVGHGKISKTTLEIITRQHRLHEHTNTRNLWDNFVLDLNKLTWSFRRSENNSAWEWAKVLWFIYDYENALYFLLKYTKK